METMTRINYLTVENNNKAELETWLDSNGYTYNPDESGASTSINNGMNIVWWDDGGVEYYADLSYLGQIPDAWDSNGEPISWTSDVYSHLASAGDLSPFPNPEPYFPNRYAGETIPVPEVVETEIRTASYTKSQIINFMDDHLIPHNSAWLKARLITAVLLWYYGSVE